MKAGESLPWASSLLPSPPSSAEQLPPCPPITANFFAVAAAPRRSVSLLIHFLSLSFTLVHSLSLSFTLSHSSSLLSILLTHSPIYSLTAYSLTYNPLHTISRPHHCILCYSILLQYSTPMVRPPSLCLFCGGISRPSRRALSGRRRDAVLLHASALVLLLARPAS